MPLHHNFTIILRLKWTAFFNLPIFHKGALDGPLTHPCRLPLLQRRLQSQILVQEALISTWRLSREEGTGGRWYLCPWYVGTWIWRALCASEIDPVGSCLMLWFFNKVAETFLDQILLCCNEVNTSNVRGKVMSQGANKLQTLYLANSIYIYICLCVLCVAK